VSRRMPRSCERYARNHYLEDLGNVPAKDLQGLPKRPHRCLGTLTKPVPRLLLSLIVENEEGIRSPIGPEPERLTPPIGTAPRGDEVAAPQDGSWFCAPTSEASSSDASAISASAATGGSTASTATTSAEAGASADNASGGLEATAAPAISPGTMAASTEESASGACPTTTCAD
jgi:hypothetical protein